MNFLYFEVNNLNIKKIKNKKILVDLFFVFFFLTVLMIKIYKILKLKFTFLSLQKLLYIQGVQKSLCAVFLYFLQRDFLNTLYNNKKIF